VLARRIQRRVIRSVFRRATHRLVHGLTVGVVTESFDAEAALDRVAAGLDLLAYYQPSTVVRLRQDAQGILVWEREISIGVASWHYGVKLIIIDARFLCDPETTSANIAAMLVHEATHARLDRLGYAPEKRAQVEAVCFRRERGFARRLPDSQELLAEIDRQLQRDPSYWADDTHIQRVGDELAKRSVPSWLIRAIQRLCGRAARR
jgi:hypothetical protein